MELSRYQVYQNRMHTRGAIITHGHIAPLCGHAFVSCCGLETASGLFRVPDTTVRPPLICSSVISARGYLKSGQALAAVRLISFTCVPAAHLYHLPGKFIYPNVQCGSCIMCLGQLTYLPPPVRMRSTQSRLTNVIVLRCGAPTGNRASQASGHLLLS